MNPNLVPLVIILIFYIGLLSELNTHPETAIFIEFILVSQQKLQLFGFDGFQGLLMNKIQLSCL